MAAMNGLLRHIRACNNAVLPGGRLPLLVAGERVGWAEPAFADRLMALGAAREADGVGMHPGQLQPFARTLSEAGLFRWRSEAFDVRAAPDGPALAQLDRGALPSFGVQALGVHLNGLVGTPSGTKLWVARRAADKQLDPGKMDHLVAGGVPAGHGPMATLLKEAEEEAGLSAELAGQAKHVATIGYAMQRREGLRRDVLYCYDLHLPEDFVPEARDGEVEAFELWELPRVLQAVRDTDAFKFNVNLVLIDLFLRRGMLDHEEAASLRPALTAREIAG
jgi:8-oxo-dGTP pyrophosphatase MutT (NUDIX family)